MQTIKKDILTVTEGIICQQVNCKGVMGSGLAKSIRDKWPKVYTSYSSFCKEAKNDFDLLGKINFVQISCNLWVANIFGQYGYGAGKHTEYCALNLALKKIPHNSWNIYFPWKVGADRGGGDFNIIQKIIEFRLPDAVFCKLPE